MPQNPSPREQASAALGEPVEQWIERHRKSAAKLTYRQISRVLNSEHGIDVNQLRGSGAGGRVTRDEVAGAVPDWVQAEISAEVDAEAAQALTTVDPAHRGHRLGLLVKRANLRQRREHYGNVTTIWTGNATTNANMIAINDQVGFRPVDARVSYKRLLDQ